jgi:hypothetical protein
MKTLHSKSAATNVQKPDSETPQNKDAYRAPRLVPLGTAIGLVHARVSGEYWDGGTAPLWRQRNYQ